ncbi:MAG: prolyl oligopeptidase family serine peptidase [Prevotellaceae bacterium]|jgi:prolyl oligopeptidase|nr:prolyl oligopeptidase family serine peptidase [Prevotellaceae bacterium]
MKTLIPLSLLLIACACGTRQNGINYPASKIVDTADKYFDTQVADPYRWLEDDNSDETKAWVDAQNSVTFNYLESVPYRDSVKARLTKLWNYPKQGVPSKKAGRYFYTKNDGLQNQSVLYVKDVDGTERILIDPNTLSADGTVALSRTSVSKNGVYMAYMIASAGSDWNTIHVLDVATGQKLDDELRWIKFSGISWYKNGFFYSRYDEPKTGTALTSKNEYHKLYYHTVGESQSKDKLVFVDKEHPLRNCGADVTDDERFLIVSQSESTDGNKVYIKNLEKNTELIPFNDNFDSEWNPVANTGDDVYFHTNCNAPKYKLVKVNLEKLASYGKDAVIANAPDAPLSDLIPESENVLNGVSHVGGKLFAVYLKDARSEIKIYGMNGAETGELSLPALGSCGGVQGEYDDNEAYFAFTSFTFPTVIYKYDVANNTYSEYFKPDIDFNFDDYLTEQVFYESKDGTKVPMFIVRKKDMSLNGNNPALLYGYGGFNASLTPSFSVSRLLWLEQGGVYALANIRGGGEYGEEWHKAGTKMNKQNVFDDFIAAAEYLIAQKYTSPAKLGIQGGSNGGLLIGAVVNQRPELFGAAVPQVGVMDMLRYQTFTIGWAWAGDYGTSADSKEMFEYLYAYSPLHNISDKADYPAVMVMTADHDDRVVPAHSFKYAATLQAKQKNGKNPALIRIQTKAGHGAGRSTTVAIEEAADIWTFLFKNLNVKVQEKFEVL